MNIREQIRSYIASLPESKQAEMEQLQQFIGKAMPRAKLWFEDGKDEKGKVVTNPNIGYGSYTIEYANGKTREFFQVGLSANTSGISVYIMGLEDKNWLPENYGTKLGKAKVTGYCIKFRTIKDIDLNQLREVIKYRLAQKG